ncbi:MAG: molybdate ABC transporter substrate-binding protein [Propionibacteriales bacterium]|nr:molybdate ABC transporter substrate-binding protein [Propionibacteriales bacterium]
MTPPRRSRVLALVAATALAVPLAGCGAEDTKGSDQTLTVYAAASLTGTFTELGQQFEATHPGVTVSFSFGGSSDLVSQIQGGAPADVFASADLKNMDKLSADQGSTPVAFASNTLEIVTPPDNPGKVDSLDDLADQDLAIAVCAPEVPCGSAAATVAAAAGITLAPDTEEQSVKDVLAKVSSGEADAGLVYVTDARAAGAGVNGITFPESASAVNVYPITTLKDSKNPDLAAAFMAFVSSTEGQAVFAAAGFAPAP